MVIYLTISVSIVSCIKTGVNIPIPDLDYTTSMIAFRNEVEDLKLPKNNFSSYHSKYILDGRYLYGVNMKSPNIIDVYDLNGEEESVSIVVDKSLLHDRISGIYVNTKDSIYFCQSDPNIIYLINSFGEVIDIWNEVDLKIRPTDHSVLSKYPITFPTFLGQCSPIVIDDLMFIAIDPAGIYQGKKMVNRVGIYDLSKRSWVSFISEQPNQRIGHSYPYDLEQPYITEGDDCILVSYPMDHYVQIFSIDNTNIVNKYPFYSQNAIDLSYPLKDRFMNSCQKNWNYRIQTPFYGPLYYHEELGVYSRVFYHSQELIYNKQINDGTTRKTSIVIMDNDFNMIGESVFDNGQIGVYSCLPLPDGYVVSPQLNIDTLSMLNYSNKIEIKPCV